MHRVLGALPAKSFLELHKLVTEGIQEWQPSTFYNARERKNQIKTDVRSSHFLDALKYPFLESLLFQTLRDIGFLLVPLDFQFLRYQEGDFFARHRDHIQCPELKDREYTFLLTIQAAQEGGDTLVYDDDGEPENLSLKPNHMVLFDKKTPHSADKVEEGTKYVLKGTAIRLRADEPVVVIFVQKEGRYFILPVSKLPPRCSYAVEYRNELRKNPNRNRPGIVYLERHRDSDYVLSLNWLFVKKKYQFTLHIDDLEGESDVEDAGPDEDEEESGLFGNLGF